MRRPNRGRTFEEALAHWSAEGAYDRMRQFPDPSQFRVKGSALSTSSNRHGNARLRELLEDALYRKLREGELWSTAVELPDDDRARRWLVPCEVYADPGLRHDPATGTIRGEGFVMLQVEVFVPTRRPSNLPEPLEWRDPRTGTTRQVPAVVDTLADPLPQETLKHDPTFEHIRFRGEELFLTPTQAGIVRMLHEARHTDRPWLDIAEIRGRVRFETAKMMDLFRRNKPARALIESDRKGRYRLVV